MARQIEPAAVIGLDLLAEVEQRLRLESGADSDRGVQEVGLVEHLADRLGLVGGGDGLDRRPLLGAQAGERRAQVRLALADIGAQPEIARPH